MSDNDYVCLVCYKGFGSKEYCISHIFERHSFEDVYDKLIQENI